MPSGKNKVLLIQPLNTLSLNMYPPLNLVQIGTSLSGRGYEVEIVTCPTEGKYMEKILSKAEDALFVGLTTLTPEVPSALVIAGNIKKRLKVPLVWGGWHATLFPEQMAESKLVDKVIVDEGDEAIVKIAELYSKNRSVSGSDKIVASAGKIDMNTLPCPDYSLVPNIEQYINSVLPDKFLEFDTRKVRWLPYQASRGCPHRCSFCINVVTGNRNYRHKSAEKVVSEIKTIVQIHRINHVKIIDDNLFVNVPWLKEIGMRLIENDLNITWDAECRVDYFNDKKVNDECLALLVKSGLNELNFGIESGSQRTLDMSKKDITPDQSLYALQQSADFGIVNRCSFIIDMPGEEKEDILKTVDLINKIRKIPKTTCGIHTYRPYPKSELCDRLLKEGLIKQPSKLEEWGEKDFIEQFTYADAKRTWQKNYALSSKVSFYQNLESGFWLRTHQISNSWIEKINNFFIGLARTRNRNFFYGFSIDRKIYTAFRFFFFKFRQMMKKV
jgi:anaerobic magnesium-protoporphyrin IX monomethyl ester cyclase